MAVLSKVKNSHGNISSHSFTGSPIFLATR